jgi:AbrB family looped-hinge helix DNA binding protein
MSHVIYTKISEGRRVAIPAELCREYGLQPGDEVVLESSESGIMLRPRGAVIRDVQDFFADAAPADVVVSEELSRERRAEAAREEHD